MALQGALTLRRPIPHEPGEWMDLRMLGWKALERARQAKSIDALRTAAAAGAEALNVANQLGNQRAEEPAPAPVERDPIAEYDLSMLLTDGIAAWSYDQPLSTEWIERLDEETARWAAHELIEPLIEPQGKGSNGLLVSTATSMAKDEPPTNG